MAQVAQQRPLFEPMTVFANHFRFLAQNKDLYQYAISFRPEVENKTNRYKLLSQMRNLLGDYSFDGTMLFLQRRIDEQDVVLNGDRGEQVTVSLLFTKTLPPAEMEQPLQLYNMLFRKILRILKLRQIGRHYYDPTRSVAVPAHHIDLWPGYFTAVNVMDSGPMLVVDVSHKVLRTDTVLEYIQGLSGRNVRQIAQNDLVGQIVLTRYNNKTYRIDDLDFQLTPASTFTRKDGTEMSYLEYYAAAYSKSIQVKEQPLIVHRHKRKGQPDEIFHLIPELCFLTGISDTMRRDFHVMRDIAKHTRVPPAQRSEQMLQFVNHTKDVPDVRQELANWDMSIDTNLLEIQGKRFSRETVFFGGDKSVTIDAKTAEWSRDLKNSRLLKAKDMKKWMIVYVQQNTTEAKNFCMALMQVGQEIGMNIAQPKRVELPDDRKETYLDCINEVLVPDVDCVVCILPNNRKERYDSLKILLTLEKPSVSQCVVARSINQPNILKSVVHKIALQINCKMGGQLWRVNIPLRETMVLGVDIGPRTSAGGKSVVGFCANMNEQYTQFESRAVIQRSGQELVAGLHDVMVAFLRRWFEYNKTMPKHIIVYRDGIGEGMIPAVQEHEISQFKAAFESFEGYNPGFVFIIVKKRVHTRLFEKNGSANANPTPGTCVDSGCTTTGPWNFFLVSQHVNEGTVTPAHYVVLENSDTLAKEHIQALTYKLTHMYYNWPGTIRVPAVCQYAHKLAFLVGQTLQREPTSPRYPGLLYYL